MRAEPCTRAGQAAASGLALILLACSNDKPERVPSYAELADPQVMVDEFANIDHFSAGVSTAVVSGGIARFYSAGRADKGSGALAGPDTEYELASVSKVLLGVVLGDMVARGEIALDDPIADYLPPGVVVASKDGVPITARHLATHSSGLPHDIENHAWATVRDRDLDYPPEKLWEFLAQVKLRSVPGAQYSYSNVGAGLLGEALALRAGQSYEDLIQERLFAPLGMVDSTIILSPEQRQRLATPYDGDGDRTSEWLFPRCLEACGGVHTTARDLGRFGLALLGDRPASLDPAFVTALTTPGPAGVWSEGLFWSQGPSFGGLVYGHLGGDYGFRSFLGVDVTHGTAAAVLTNGTHDPLALGLALLNSSHIVAVDPALLTDYVGRYGFGGDQEVSITQSDGMLAAQLTGEPKRRIFPESERKFFNLVDDVILEFVRDESGVVVGVSESRNGVTNYGGRL